MNDRFSVPSPVWERDRVRGRESRGRFTLPQLDDVAVRSKRIRRLRWRIRNVHTNRFLDNSFVRGNALTALRWCASNGQTIDRFIWNRLSSLKVIVKSHARDRALPQEGRNT